VPFVGFLLLIYVVNACSLFSRSKDMNGLGGTKKDPYISIGNAIVRVRAGYAFRHVGKQEQQKAWSKNNRFLG
jgi:hypothetical protein